MRVSLGQIAPGVWVAKNSTGKTVAALVSAPDGARSVKEFFACLCDGPKFPFDPSDVARFKWVAPDIDAPTGWDPHRLELWAEKVLGRDPDCKFFATAKW